MKIDIDQKICQSKLSYFFLQKIVESRKIFKSQGKLGGVIKESRIEGLAGMDYGLELVLFTLVLEILSNLQK